MKTRKRLTVVFGLAAVVLAVAAVMGGYLFRRNYRVLAGKPYARSSRYLDLSGVQGVEFARLAEFPNLEGVDLRGTGLDAESYQMLTNALPECRILWQIPFQGTLLEMDTQEVTVTSLPVEDAKVLALVPGLCWVDASECRD